MLNSLSITGFRGFSDFTMPDLGRVNLLVGSNNSGKSSILEAVQMLFSPAELSVFWQIAARRGERVFDGAEIPVRTTKIDMSHFFFGHQIKPDRNFIVSANSEHGNVMFSLRISESPQKILFEDKGNSSGDYNEDVFSDSWIAEFEWSTLGDKPVIYKISNRGAISFEGIRRIANPRATDFNRVSFISATGMDVEEVVRMFEEVVLTKEENTVIKALQSIEPEIERIATVNTDRMRTKSGDRGGIVLKCKGIDQRIPIGSMGDGLWRMLGLALALVKAEGGVLLVDEIDTGLHYTVMKKMWKLIDTVSKRLSVQVFATTHSRDCFRSLADISRENVSDHSEITIQRIDRDKKQAVSYSEQEIIAVAEHDGEVR